MINNFDVAIIGAGVAGMKAALILNEYELDICVIDDGNSAGGQFVRYPNAKPTKASPPSYKKGLEQVEKFENLNITYFNKSELIFINKDKEIVFKDKDKNLYEINPKTIIIATGAREIVQPFKGWDLPGVITTGAMQILLKSSGRTFAKEAVIAGSGILPYAAGATWLDKGGEITSFYDTNSFADKFSMLTSALSSSEKRPDFFSLLPKMMKLQTKAKNSYRVIEAKGRNKLESIIVAQINNQGEIIEKTKFEQKTSLLAIGEGLIANLDVASLASCEATYDKTLGGMILKTNEKLETTVSGIFAAGALTGVGGADKAELEGEYCAYSVLEKLGKLDIEEYRLHTYTLNNKRVKILEFSNLLSSMQQFNIPLLSKLDKNTTICRCEDIKLEDIQNSIESGFTSINSIKKRTRAGMGNCQGKTCSEIVRNILLSYKIEDNNSISVRPPLRPTSIKCLSSEITKIDSKKIIWKS